MRTTEEHYNYVKENYHLIESTYLQPGPLTDKSRLMFIKLFGRLTDEERKIIILYAELKSCRKVGRFLGISRQTANSRINQIKGKLL